MTKILAIAAGALALGLIAHAPAQAEVTFAGTFSTPMGTIKVGDFTQNVTYGYRVSIRKIVRKLRRRGYSQIAQTRWLRHAYVINAQNWRGRPVRIKVNAYSGNVIWVKPIPHYNGGGWRHGGGWQYNGDQRHYGGPRRRGY